MLKDFLNFIKEYNVTGLAIAFVMGSATDAFIKSFVNNLVMPLFSPLLTAQWREAVIQIGFVRFGIGAFIADAIHFIILAFVIYLVVKRVMKLDRIPKK